MKDNPRDLIPWLAAALVVLAYFPFLFSTQCLYPLSIHGWEIINKWHGEIPDMGYWELQAYWYKTHLGRYTGVALGTTWPYWHNLTAFRLLTLIDLLPIPDQASQLGLGNFSCLIRRPVNSSVAIRPI